MIYLPHLDAVLRVDSRHQDGWLCHVVASRDDPLLTRRHLILTADAIAEGTTSLTLDHTADPDGFATLIWHTTIVRHWVGGAIHGLGRILPHHIRHPPASPSTSTPPPYRDLSHACTCARPLRRI